MIRSHVFAGIVSLSLAFNNPIGHELVHGSFQRLAFWEAWRVATNLAGRPLSFAEFKKNPVDALMIVHDNVVARVKAGIKLLKLTSAFCQPLGGDGNDQSPRPFAPVMPCHAGLGSCERRRDL